MKERKNTAMQFDINRLNELYEIEGRKTTVAKIYCQENGIEFNDSIRKRIGEKISAEKSTTKVTEEFDNDVDTETNQYSNDKENKQFFMPSAWDKENNRFLSIDEFCEKYNLPKEQVRSSKLISHQAGHITYNVAFNASTDDEDNILDLDFIDSVVKKYINPITVKKLDIVEGDFISRLLYTDTHVGLSTEGGRNTVSLYSNKWDKEELLKRLDIMVEHTIRHRKGSTLYVDELGDFCDGLFGQTTRGGHGLPQNMDDKEVFELGVEFKVKLVEKLVPYFDKIICNSLTNDNHSFIFSYFINSTVKKILEIKYSPEIVEYNILEKFINHYSIGNHTFIISHGKDSSELKNAMKPILDAKQAEKIDQYCKENKLYNGNYVEFSKGDSHQFIMDFTTSNDFDYFTFPAFSPPSNWAGTNFKNTKSGFSLFNIDKKSDLKIHIPYWFR